jgi:hypothetical protein
MRLYISFFIRCWLLRDTPQVKGSVINVERVEPENGMSVADLIEPGHRMFEARRLTQLPADATRGWEHESNGNR